MSHTSIQRLVYTMADVGRISRLSGGRCDPEDEMATVTYLAALMKAALLHGRVPRPPK